MTDVPDLTPGSRPRKQIAKLKQSGTVRVGGEVSDVPTPVGRSLDEPEPVLEGGGGREMRGLEARSTSVESVRVGDAPVTGERQIKALAATMTVTSESGPADATPLVVNDDGTAEPDLNEAADHTVASLLGEVKGLRSRVMILRTERTAMAGRKYALEVVLESLKEKLEAVDKLLEGVDAPGELGLLLTSIREAIGSARRVALGRDVLSDELEQSKAQHLEERRVLETKLGDANEKVAGLKGERDSLRERATFLERERLGFQQRITELEGALATEHAAHSAASQAADELESIRKESSELRARFAGHEKERGEYLDKIAELEGQLVNLPAIERDLSTLRGQVEEHRAEAARAVQNLEEAVALGEGASRTIDVERAKASSAEARLAEVTLRVSELETVAAAALQRATEAEARAAEAESRVGGAQSRGNQAETRIVEAEGRAIAAEARLGELEARAVAAEVNVATWESRAQAGKQALQKTKGDLDSVTGRVTKAEQRALELEVRNKELEARAGKGAQSDARLSKLEKVLAEQKGALAAAKPLIEALDKDNQRLARLLGDARARARVNVEELMARAELLKRLERLAKAEAP
jgi:chromosome segregation ATPase